MDVTLKRLWFAPLVLWALSVPAAAQDSQATGQRRNDKLVALPADELTKIEKRLEKHDHLAVDFKQLVYTPLRKKTISYRGKAQFSRPAMFRWEQTDPTAKQMIYDGRDFYMYFPDQKVAHKYSAHGAQADEIEKLATIVLSLNKLLELYTIEESKYDTVNKLVYLTLTPKAKNEITGVKIELHALKEYLKNVQLTYSDGKVITYEFSHPKRTPIAKSQYIFVKPQGVKLEVFD